MPRGYPKRRLGDLSKDEITMMSPCSDAARALGMPRETVARWKSEIETRKDKDRARRHAGEYNQHQLMCLPMPQFIRVVGNIIDRRAAFIPPERSHRE